MHLNCDCCSLVLASQVQPDLFDRQDRPRSKRLMAALDAVNERWGAGTVEYVFTVGVVEEKIAELAYGRSFCLRKSRQVSTSYFVITIQSGATIGT